ncbi:MAG TPA: hypothetical protein VKQ72_09900 [Aggregatilineales bacterium]|nr:hypothetical protein [Aggregatilineales bacterium]
MPYYPNQTLIIGLTTIRRERRLPPGAIGQAAAREASHVEAQDIVLQGALPGEFIMLDALRPLGLRRPEQFNETMLTVQPGNTVERWQVIAQNGSRTLKAPRAALLAHVEDGQIVLQTDPEPIDIYALCPGEITSVRGAEEVLLETVGALIQGVWGNGKRTFSAYKMEPQNGIDTLASDDDTTFSEYKGSAIILTHPIASTAVFDIAKKQEMTAIVAPSMSSDLRATALRQNIPIILTSGFGDQQMSELVYNLLRDNLGRPAMFDATEPERWSPSRPEIVIPLPTGGQLPPPPETDAPLVEGALVRLTRAPYAGMSGRIRRLVETPRSVENGLRLPGAEVQVAGGRTVFVPLANIELLGRSGETAGIG